MTPRSCPVEYLPKPRGTVPASLTRYIRDNTRAGKAPTVQTMLGAGFRICEILPILPPGETR